MSTPKEEFTVRTTAATQNVLRKIQLQKSLSGYRKKNEIAAAQFSDIEIAKNRAQLAQQARLSAQHKPRKGAD